jgi:hypothetical protein
VSLRKLSTHPTCTRSVRDDGSHSAHVCDWMSAGKFTEALQLSYQLQYHFLMNVVDFFALSSAEGV